jgi:hypothetical protein
MNRLFAVALFVLAAVLAWPAHVRAQIPTAPPTATPDPQVFTDDGMWFKAPEAFQPLGARHVKLADLGGDDMTPLAAWIYPNKDNPRRIILSAESFEGSVGDWDSTFEQQMRGQFDGALFRDRQNFAMRNGMPAMFMTMSSGEGFDVQKLFIVIWADGSRGMALVLVTKLDDLDEARARAFLSDVTAVRYPADRG